VTWVFIPFWRESISHYYRGVVSAGDDFVMEEQQERGADPQVAEQ
jgi:hypothetical protein